MRMVKPDSHTFFTLEKKSAQMCICCIKLHCDGMIRSARSLPIFFTNETDFVSDSLASKKKTAKSGGKNLVFRIIFLPC